MEGRLRLDDARIRGQQAPLGRDEIGPSGQKLGGETGRNFRGNRGETVSNLQTPDRIAPGQKFDLQDAAVQLLAAEMNQRFSFRQVRQGHA